MRSLARAFVFIGLVALCALVGGCAVGRGQMGEIVLGVEAGRLAETGSEVLGAAAETFLGPLGFAGTGGVVAGAGGLVWGFVNSILKARAANRAATAEAVAKAEREKRELADSTWDAAQLDAVRAAISLPGRPVAPVAAVAGNVPAGGPAVRADEAAP